MTARFFVVRSGESTPGGTPLIEQISYPVDGPIECLATVSRVGYGDWNTNIYALNQLSAGADGDNWGYGGGGRWNMEVAQEEDGTATVYLLTALKYSVFNSIGPAGGGNVEGIYFALDWDALDASQISGGVSLNGDGYPSFRLFLGPLTMGEAMGSITVYQTVAPTPVASVFWTRLVGTSEKLSAPGPSPEAGGKTPETATVISSLPYSTTLGAIFGAAVLWFKVTLGAGAYRFHTTASPDPTGHDTHIALFSAAGAVIAVNDDVSGEDYRSSITETLPAGDYHIAIGGHGSAAGSGFSFVPSGNIVAPGAVFRVEAA